MTRKNINRKIFILTPVIAGMFALWAIHSVSAADTTLQLQITSPPPPAVDVCPNIPGDQATIPAGMLQDASGNCYTPTPPPPPPVDLCNNISGVQSTLPAGYYRTSSGNCYPQALPPAPVVDVCPNIDGVQTVVPEGFQLTPNNTCEKVVPPTDVCPNIPGPQATIPDGMKLENDVCYTPTPPSPTPPNTTNNTNDTQNTTQPPLKNVPPVLEPLARVFVNLVPEGMREWLKALPADIARTVPYYIFIMVAILALIPILQSIREALFARQLAILLKQERDIADQKDNFVTLASHYLRTPLTLMKSGLDTISALGEVTAEALQPLKLDLDKLEEGITSVLHDVENNAALRGISQPITATKTPSVWRSGWFWGPIISSVVITFIANFLLAVVGDKEIGITNEFFQFLVASIAFGILYLGVRNLHLKKKLHAENQALIDHERIVDEARNSFIANTTSTLQDGLEPIIQSKVVVDQAPSGKFFNEGYERIEGMLQKFLLLSQVQTGADRNLETFDLHEVIDNLLVTYNAAISEKRLTVANMTSPTFIKQNRLLFNFVLSSVLDNAIKFNQEGGSIEISAAPEDKVLSIKVSDNGIGIDNDKLGQLFKPFSRASSAVEFNYEGLGFSLFLDKIIMDYTGGSIQAESSVNEGTQLLVTTPVTTNA